MSGLEAGRRSRGWNAVESGDLPSAILAMRLSRPCFESEDRGGLRSPSLYDGRPLSAGEIRFLGRMTNTARKVRFILKVSSVPMFETNFGTIICFLHRY